MNGLSVSPEMLQKGYEAMSALMIGLFSSDDEVAVEAAPCTNMPETGYMGVSEISPVPIYSQAASCSIFRVGEPGAQTFTILGLMLLLYGSCSMVAVGASRSTPERRPTITEDPFTTMNGYGDKVY